MPMFLSDKAPISPYRVAWEINEFLTDNTIYIGDGGDVVTITAQAVQPRRPGHWMDPGPLGTLGVGTGFAMAAKLAHPEKEVLCYYGDGSFGMTAFDIETADRFNAPFVAVIGNNSAMNQIRCGQIIKYGEQRGNIGNKLGDVNFEVFGHMLGNHGEAVRGATEVAQPEKGVLGYCWDVSFAMTTLDTETADRFTAPFVAVIGNDSAMNQIRCGQIIKYGEQRGNIGNKLGDVNFEVFGHMLGNHGEAVRDASEIAPALRRAREAVQTTGRPAVVNIWVDPTEYAPGTKNQTMYK